MKINLKWPKEEGNNLIPWYMICSRVLFIPFIYLGFCISFLAIVPSFGIDTATSWWEGKDYFD